MFCGGGSAGHVIPNIAVIEDIKKTTQSAMPVQTLSKKIFAERITLNFTNSKQ